MINELSDILSKNFIKQLIFNKKLIENHTFSIGKGICQYLLMNYSPMFFLILREIKYLEQVEILVPTLFWIQKGQS